MGIYTDLVILVNSVALWRLTRDFANFLQEEMSQSEYRSMGFTFASTPFEEEGGRKFRGKLTGSWGEIRRQFDALMEISEEVNNLLGTSVTLFLLEFIFDYAVTFDDNQIFVNTNPDWKTLANCIFYLVDSGLIFYFCSDIAYQV